MLFSTVVLILSLPKINTTKYMVSNHMENFTTKKQNMLRTDIGAKVGTNDVNKI